MNRTFLVICFFLLVWTAAGIAYLVAGPAGTPSSSRHLDEQAVAEANKLLDIVSQYHQEFEKVVSSANVSDKEKENDLRESLVERRLLFQVARLSYIELLDGKDLDHMVGFIAAGLSATSTPTYSFTEYSIARGKSVPVVNATRLQELETRFRVLATELLESVK